MELIRILNETEGFFPQLIALVPYMIGFAGDLIAFLLKHGAGVVWLLLGAYLGSILARITGWIPPPFNLIFVIVGTVLGPLLLFSLLFTRSGQNLTRSARASLSKAIAPKEDVTPSTGTTATVGSTTSASLYRVNYAWFIQQGGTNAGWITVLNDRLDQLNHEEFKRKILADRLRYRLPGGN